MPDHTADYATWHELLVVRYRDAARHHGRYNDSASIAQEGDKERALLAELTRLRAVEDTCQAKHRGFAVAGPIRAYRGACGHLWDRTVEDTDVCQRCAVEAEAIRLRMVVIANDVADHCGARDQIEAFWDAEHPAIAAAARAQAQAGQEVTGG